MGAESLEHAEHEGATRSDAAPPPQSGAAPSAGPRVAPTDPSGLVAAFERGAATGAPCPAEWHDELAVAAASLAPDASLREVVASLLGVVARALPGVAVGACVPDLEGGQLVVQLLEAGAPDAAPSPTRLFPDHAVERVLRIPHDDGSTLHLASSALDAIAPGGVALAFADRVARVVGGAVRHARAHEAARRRVAELSTLEAQLIHQSRLASLGQMAAGVVHELNNPLTSIVAYADYLRKKAAQSAADAGDVERLGRIVEAADRIQRFARDLVTFSRPGGKTPTLLGVHDVVDRALHFCEHVLDQTDVVVERDFGDVPPVRGVADQLTQVFVNLFTNAAHAMRDGGGSLCVSTRLAGGEVVVTIADEGHGVDAQHLPRIFDPFFTTKTDGSGTGLGLSIVRNIVVAHGGRIRAEARAPRGTLFVLHLPAGRDDDAEPR
jgi:signal transduction histidine kinase